MTNKSNDETPTAHDRVDVILTDAERRNLRRKLKGSVQVTKNVLNPKTQMRRLVERQKKIVATAATDAKVQAKRNAPLLAAVGFAGLILAARRPIMAWFGRVTKKHSDTSDGV